jgi:glutathione-specific gamma-glutamylcyclotransferase
MLVRPTVRPTSAGRDAIDDAHEESRTTDVWLFGYGSLMWRPDVAFGERAPARLHGYRRRFWQRSTDHRGTTERPGRVVTLVPSEAASTLGIAYRLIDPQPTLDRIDVREQQGYTRCALPITLANDRASVVRAVVYVADPSNPYFLAEEPLDQTARAVAAAHGPSGSNLDYARALVACLHELVRQVGPEMGAEHNYERELLDRAEACVRGLAP